MIAVNKYSVNHSFALNKNWQHLTRVDLASIRVLWGYSIS
jgi:hypothetical protein